MRSQRPGPEMLRRSRKARSRAGFTLWEIATVMLIMAVAATLAVPAYVHFGEDRNQTSVDLLVKLLRDTRALAIEHAVTATLVIDPTSGHYRVDTTSSFGTAKVVEDTLRFGATEGLVTDLPRLRYVFRATGAAFADSVVVRGTDSTRAVIVDAWSGVANVQAR